MLSIITKKATLTNLAALAVCSLLFSFSSPWGGEGFEIYLNNKIVMQQFGSNMNTIKTLKLDQASANDEISVKYYHCGRVGKNRVIIIKDEQDKVLKQWKFSDADAAGPMICKVKDILGLKNGKDVTLKLYYSSSELSKERQLVSISVGVKTVAKL